MAWAAQNNEAKEKGAVASSKKIEEIAPKAEMSTKQNLHQSFEFDGCTPTSVANYRIQAVTHAHAVTNFLCYQ